MHRRAGTHTWGDCAEVVESKRNDRVRPRWATIDRTIAESDERPKANASEP